jgi:wyosine [tRNA(Phe)-imidazoG37] synthetase (radical SAM superfamily)
MKEIIEELGQLTSGKNEYFSRCINIMMNNPSEETFNEIKNLMESIQPELCSIT